MLRAGVACCASAMGPVTRCLILLNVATFAVASLFTDTAVAAFALWPIGRFPVRELHAVVGFHIWQLGTSAFLHADVLHLSLNMLALLMFGRDVERELSSSTYAALYAAAVLSAAVVQLAVMSRATAAEAVPIIGASGGMFGVLLAFGVLFPQRRVMLLIPPIPMSAWLFVVLYGALELTNGVLGSGVGVAHFAHLGGMLGAYLVLLVWRRRERQLRYG